AFSGWWQFIRLGVPGGIMAALDWASFEALAVIAGALGVKQLAAHTIVAQVATLSFLIPYGFAIAVSVRVGQAMGRADPSTGKRAAAVGTAAALAWGALNFLVVLPTAGLWPRAFTSDAEVIALASTAAVGVACFSTLGVGQQCIGAVVYPLAYLGAGIPLAFALAHPAGWGLLGVWGGESIGAALAVFTLGGLLAFWFDWAAMARKARAAALAGVQAPAPVVEVELADASQAGPPLAP
ncbi:slc47a1, partial [Symbiodinium sp. KB8]